jgi:hypothetical protein
VHAEPLLQLVCTVTQCSMAVLSVMGSNDILVMRNGRLESREATEASPLRKMWLRLPIPVDCECIVVQDSDNDPRCASTLPHMLLLSRHVMLHLPACKVCQTF